MLDEKAPNRIAAVRGIFFCAPEGIRTPNLLLGSHTYLGVRWLHSDYS